MDAHKEPVLTAKDAWRWMLCYKQTVLFITVIPTVILLVTNQWTKIQAFTTGAGEFALWKAKKKPKQNCVRKFMLTFFTSRVTDTKGNIFQVDANMVAAALALNTKIRNIVFVELHM